MTDVMVVVVTDVVVVVVTVVVVAIVTDVMVVVVTDVVVVVVTDVVVVIVNVVVVAVYLTRRRGDSVSPAGRASTVRVARTTSSTAAREMAPSTGRTQPRRQL